MTTEAFNHVQLSAIELAANRMAKELGATKDKDKRAVSRAVFDIAAEIDVFDADKLTEIARERMSPQNGWRFDKPA